jgi:hypothetical protein
METNEELFLDEFHEIGKKIKTKQTLFGNSTSQFSISYNDLTKLEKGSIGTITDVSLDFETNVWFFTVRFSNGVFANINKSTFDFI